MLQSLTTDQPIRMNRHSHYINDEINPLLHNNAFLTPLIYHVFENIMEYGASIFHYIFKSIQNFTYIFLDFFNVCLKIDNDVMI